jgi:hypothetical protein
MLSGLHRTADVKMFGGFVIVYFFRFMLSSYTTTLHGSIGFYGLKRSPLSQISGSRAVARDLKYLNANENFSTLK